MLRNVENMDAARSTVPHQEAAPPVAAFVRGTRVATPVGPKAVERLRAGDMVLTRDNGPQQVIYAQSRLKIGSVEAGDDAPVYIPAGALGDDLPFQDLVLGAHQPVVDPTHGFLGSADQTKSLIPAASLVGRQGVLEVPEFELVFVTVLFPRDVLIAAEGVWTACLLPPTSRSN